jgi:hypothetical protein
MEHTHLWVTVNGADGDVKHLPAAVLVSIACSVAFKPAPRASTAETDASTVGDMSRQFQAGVRHSLLPRMKRAVATICVEVGLRTLCVKETPRDLEGAARLFEGLGSKMDLSAMGTFDRKRHTRQGFKVDGFGIQAGQTGATFREILHKKAVECLHAGIVLPGQGFGNVTVMPASSQARISSPS